MGSGLLLVGQPVGDRDELLEGEILRAQVAIDAKLGQLGVGDEVGEAVADGLATLAKALGADPVQATMSFATMVGFCAGSDAPRRNPPSAPA